MLGIISLIVSLTIIAEVIFCMAKGMSPTDVTYYICRPFGISMKLKVGLIVRVLLIFMAGALLAIGFVVK